MLNVPIYEHGMSLHLLRSFFHQHYVICNLALVHILLGLYLNLTKSKSKVVYFFGVLVYGIVFLILSNV